MQIIGQLWEFGTQCIPRSVCKVAFQTCHDARVISWRLKFSILWTSFIWVLAADSQVTQTYCSTRSNKWLVYLFLKSSKDWMTYNVSQTNARELEFFAQQNSLSACSNFKFRVIGFLRAGTISSRRIQQFSLNKNTWAYLQSV